MPDLVRSSLDGDGVATVTLDNPPLNLVSMALTRQLSNCLTELARTGEVRALVLTGNGGRAFCAGSDIKEFPGLIDGGRFVSEKLAFENRTFSQIEAFPAPTVAALNGLAFGGGLEMAACCDLIVAETHCLFALPEIKLGAIPGSGGTFRVPRRIGEGRGKEMVMLGQPIDAETALSWGLINRLVPEGEALAAARSLAGMLARGPQQALAAGRACVRDAFDLNEEDALARMLERSEEIFHSEDCREGVRAFLEKGGTPKFGHARKY